MKQVLLACPTRRELRDLPAIAERLGVSLLYDDLGNEYLDKTLFPSPGFEEVQFLPMIDHAVERYGKMRLAGVTSAVGYPGMSVASVLAQRLGLPGPRPQCVMLCEHKYYSRVAQKQWVPDATPGFHLIDPKDLRTTDGIGGFPHFLKPVKSCMSMSAYQANSAEELKRLATSALLPAGFIKPFNDMVRVYTDFEKDASYLILETLLSGKQVSLEGYVSKGKVHVMGIIDAIMFPGTFSFKRFQYPSQLPDHVQERMESIARQLMTGIGYDNACFNIELMYNEETDQISIIEVNPKIASQFPDLFEKVDGLSSYAVMLEIALGQEPAWPRREGCYAVAASCVLRTFEDKKVVSVPAPEEVEAVIDTFPETRVEIFATPGKRLSDQMQDVGSYRYGLVNLGANSPDELEQSFERVKSMLFYQFAPVS